MSGLAQERDVRRSLYELHAALQREIAGMPSGRRLPAETRDRLRELLRGLARELPAAEDPAPP